jgi:hypothetical protein
VLLVFGAPSQLPLLAGPEHGLTIPLADIQLARRCDHEGPTTTVDSALPKSVRQSFSRPFRSFLQA